MTRLHFQCAVLSDSQWYGSISRCPASPQKMQGFLTEGPELYPEHLQPTDQLQDSMEDKVQATVDTLQPFVQHFSEQREALIQAVEDAVQEAGECVRILHKAPEQRPSLALCPMPADFAGSTATLPCAPRGTGEWQIQHPTCQDPLHQELSQQLLVSQQKAQSTEREAQIRGLQDTITELHLEMSMKDEDKLEQLQELHRLESRIKELTQEVNADAMLLSPVLQPNVLRGARLLKSELSQKDATIQKLRHDLLLSHQARDCQSAQLDVQEQRLSQLQTELQDSQLEHQRGLGRAQQLQRELEAAVQQADELRTQLSEVKGHLLQVEGGKDTLRKYKVKLNGETSSQEKRRTESPRAQDRAEQLQIEVSCLRAQQSSARQELLEKNAELQREAEEPPQQERRWGRESSALLHQLNLTRKELHSATLRVKQSEAEASRWQQVAQRETAERERELRSWKEHQHEATEELDLCGAELQEVWWARDMALTSLHLQGESTQKLLLENQGLQEALKSQRTKAPQNLQKEEREEAMHADLVQLRQLYTSCFSQLVQEQDTVSRLRDELRDSLVQQEQLSSRVKQLTVESQQLSSELGLLSEKHRGAQQEVVARNEAVLKLTVELRATQEHLRSEQEEVRNCSSPQLHHLAFLLSGSVLVMNLPTSNLHPSQSKYVSKLCELFIQQGALSELRGELEHWRAQAKTQEERVEKEVRGLHAELNESKACLQQYRSSTERLRSDVEQAQRQCSEAEQEASQKDRRLHAVDAELGCMRKALQDARALAADGETRLQSLAESLDIYKQKYQACLEKVTELEGALLFRDEDLKEARQQVSEREEQVFRLQAECALLRHDLQAHCAQLESGDEAFGTLSEQLRHARLELEESREHGRECEQVVLGLREIVASLRHQAEEHEETLVRTQADFSAYKATHIHPDSDFDAHLAHIDELQQELSSAVEERTHRERELAECCAQLNMLKVEVQMLSKQRSDFMSEVLQLQEMVKQLEGEAVADKQHMHTHAEVLEQRLSQLEEELREAQQQCAQKQKAVVKRDALLRQSEADLVEAREVIHRKSLELDRQAAINRTLEADFQKAKRESLQRESNCATQKMELEEAHTSCRNMAQDLARQEEKVLLVEAGQQWAEEQLGQRVAELVRAEQAQRKLQTELRGLQEQLDVAQHQVQGYRYSVERLKAEVSESKQLQQGVQRTEAELASSKELIHSQQQQLREQTEAIRGLRVELSQKQARLQELQSRTKNSEDREASLEMEREDLRVSLGSAQQLLKEREKQVSSLQQSMSELQSATIRLQEEQESCRRELGAKERQNHRLGQEARLLEETLSRLKAELQEVQDDRKRAVRETATAAQRLKELKVELSSAQTSCKEGMELVCASSVIPSSLCRICGSDMLGSIVVHKVVLFPRICAVALEARLYESRVAHLWAQLAGSQRRAQEDREGEVAVLKVQLSSLRDDYHSKVAQVDALCSQLELMKQKLKTAANEVEVLRQSLGCARSDSSRLHKESELVVSNVNQWVKEQRKANEKLLIKIREQSKKIVHLTAEKDQLQESREELLGEIRKLKAQLDDMSMQLDWFRVLHVSSCEQPVAQELPSLLQRR
ncbi:polyamine-modulated factor 1-binding protein 1 isoform X3 [Arapaima gigas]